MRLITRSPICIPTPRSYSAWTMLFVLLLLLPSGPALAAPVVEIEVVITDSGAGSGSIGALGVGDTLTATIYLENPGSDIVGYTIGLDYDSSELSFVSATEFLPAGFTDNSNVGTGNVGLCGGLLFEAAALPPADPVGGRYPIGVAVFTITNEIDDGLPDLVTQTCSGTTDEAIYDGALSDVSSSASFESINVGDVIVPSTDGWAIFGLVMLLAATGWGIAGGRRALQP